MVRRKTVEELLTDARASLARVDPASAFEALQRGVTLIDTRSDDQRANDGSIPGALNIPLSVLEWRVDPSSGFNDDRVGGFDDPIILICAHGFSSSLAAQRLQHLGFTKATDVVGGFEAWMEAGLPVERPTAT